MNNKKEKSILMLEYPNKKNSIFQNLRMNDNKKINNKILRLFILINALIILFFFYFKNKKNNIKKNKTKYDIDFNYTAYEKNIITTKIRNNSKWQLGGSQPYFINGLIRKFKPKNCLEIGVANGGSSILILNAIKDIPDSRLISLDLNTQLYYNKSLKTGYRVNQYFPELAKNWKLLTGQQPHRFLIKLNIKFDFVFLDTAHSAAGEILNFLELSSFLNENAIFVLHDILWHFHNKIKFYPSNVYLYPVINGDKVLLKNENGSIGNMGAIFLYSNQERYYLDYFFLLLAFWEYMPKDKEINELRIFFKNFYKKDIYLNIFDTAVKRNKISIKIQQKYYRENSSIKKKNKYFKNLVYGKKI
jgi:predicted O-methyltransferase YrrM